MTNTDDTAVPPPRVDPWNVTETPVNVRLRSDLEADVMRVRDCSKPRASEWIDKHGATHAERYVRAASRESRWGGRWGDGA